ncbi:ER membrane protein complex subunit 2 [Plasmodiophora brassicae]
MASLPADDVWDALQARLLASLDAGRLSTASACLKALSDRFPGSRRVHRLAAMVQSASGRFDEAVDDLQSLLQQDPVDLPTRKAMISIYKAKGDWARALQHLLNLLDYVPSDVHSWQELVDMYVRMRQYSYARFAQEEVLLLQPASYDAYCTYAELCLTSANDAKSRDVARRYYAAAIELNPDDNARALYGVLLVTRPAPAAKGGKTGETHGDLRQVALDMLLGLYRAKANQHLRPYVERFALAGT